MVCGLWLSWLLVVVIVGVVCGCLWLWFVVALVVGGRRFYDDSMRMAL